MSPYPAKVTREMIVHRARAMIESEGVEALSLGKLAAELGIAAPSLYNHFRNKAALLQAVNADTATAMTAAMLNAASSQTDLEMSARFLRLARAHRTFACANPATYTLAFSNLSAEQRADASEMEQLAIPLQQIIAEQVGEARSLAATRGAWALMHGFAMLEISGQFRRAGSVDEAFEQSMTAFINGW